MSHQTLRALKERIAAYVQEVEASGAHTASFRIADIKALLLSVGQEATEGVTVLPSALAGLTDAMGGKSGATVIEIGSHEITDLALSGQAYSLDGRYNFRMADDSLRTMWEASKLGGQEATPPQEHEHEFIEIEACRHCMRTQADIDGECHHCNEKPGPRCWWCLRPQGWETHGYEGKPSAVREAFRAGFVANIARHEGEFSERRVWSFDGGAHTAQDLEPEAYGQWSASKPSPEPPQTVKAETMTDAAEMLWVVLANVSGGDWGKQTPEWQEAAARWRDNYFAALKASPPPSTDAARPQEEWQPIATAREGVWVLAWQPNWPRMVVAVRGTENRGNADIWFTKEGETAKPTHWRPLPPPPQASGGQDA